MKEKIEQVLNEQVKPMLAMHGGSVDLVEITDDMVVRVSLKGACGGCPGAQMTLKAVVEEAIKAQVPGIKGVEAV